MRLSRGMSTRRPRQPSKAGRRPRRRPQSFQPGDRAKLFTEFGEFVESFAGTYILRKTWAPWWRTCSGCQRTEHVVGLAGDHGGLGDPSPVTAYGVAEAIRWLNESRFKEEPRKLKVAVQGLGKVGYYLCKELAADGYKLVVTDVNETNVERVRAELGAEVLPAAQFLGVECDVFAPCAMGKVVNDATLPQFRTRAVCGAANNQLANTAMGGALRERGILYLPDYIVNLGGLTLVYQEIAKADMERARRETRANIRAGLEEVVALAEKEKVSTNLAADEIMRRRIYGEVRPFSADSCS